MKKYEKFYSNISQKSEKSVVSEILKLLEKPDIISFAGGFPSSESFPIKDIEEITAQVMRNEAKTVLQYSTTEGDRVLKNQLIEYYHKKAYQLDMDNILITSASQQALDIIGKVFLNKDDKIILSLPSYLGAISAFKQYEPEFIGIELDECGMRADKLEEVLKDLKAKDQAAKFIYLIPDFQNPTGITMPNSRRKEILKLAQEYQVLIIEDSPYKEIRFKGEEQDSFYSLAQNDLVVNIGTFSKILSPGFRLGWIFANKEIIEKMVGVKQSMDLCTSIFNQRIVGRYMEKGYFEKNIFKIKELYKVKVQAMLNAFEKYMPKGVSWTSPEGGLFLFMTLPSHIDTTELLNKAIKQHKVAFIPGNVFYFNNQGKNKLRINFSYESIQNIEEGIKRLAKAIEEEL